MMKKAVAITLLSKANSEPEVEEQPLSPFPLWEPVFPPLLPLPPLPRVLVL
jgi:hypothetical protein